MPRRLVPIELDFTDVAPDTNVVLTLMSDTVGWSLGGPGLFAGGLELGLDPDASRSLGALEMSRAVLALSTRRDTQSANRPVNIRLSHWLDTDEAVRDVKGQLVINDAARVTARIDSERQVTWSNGVIEAAW